MTFTKQPRFLPCIDKTDRENAEPLSFQLTKTGHSATDEMNNSLTSIECGLSKLYVRLFKLNEAVLILKKQIEKGEKI